MSQFREVTPSPEFDWCLSMDGSVLFIGSERFDYDQALALRDWLNKALGEPPVSEQGPHG